MQTGFETISLFIEQKVATLVLNRPKVLNALNSKMAEELLDAFDQLIENENVHVIVLTGEGRAFCSGQDLKEFEEPDQIQVADVLNRGYNPLIMRIHTCPKVVIGKINGLATGAGLSLALCCDMLISVKSAVFSMAFVRLGLVPDCGSSYLLPRLVGKSKAFELCALGQNFTANEAQKLGMVYGVAENLNDLDEQVGELAQKMASGPIAALGMMKLLLLQSPDNDLETMLGKEALCQEQAVKTAYFKHATKAFQQKR